MRNDTKTHNGDSKNYHLSPEQAAELLEKTDKCTVIVTTQKEIGRECAIDVMAAEIETAKKVKDGIRPEKQGDSINPQYAAEFGETVVIVTDRSKGSSEKAGERQENETQKAARRKLELSQRAEEKYNADMESDR